MKATGKTTKRQSEARKRTPSTEAPALTPQPWHAGDPGKKVSINVPFPEPLMLQLDWLIEHRAIRSKSSFIRECVAEAAARETQRTLRVMEAMRRIDKEDGRG